MSPHFFYFITLKLIDVPGDVSVEMRIVCGPIGILCVVVSPDLVVASILSSRNQNIFADGFSLIA